MDPQTSLQDAPDTGEEKLLMWQLLRTFIWLDRGLQENLEARGWPSVSRTESQVMILVSAGVNRPIDIARSLGLTRQAINQTINLLREKRLLTMTADPDDRRCKIVTFSDDGIAMRSDAKEILSHLEDELAKKVGAASLRDLKHLPKGKLGPPPRLPT